VDIREIECFLAVARNLHFRRSAEELHLSPATVSEAVRRLETEIGAPLFDRTTRQVSLTEFGRSFQPEALAAYQAVTDTFERGRELAAVRASVLRVGYSSSATERLVAACARVNRDVPGVSMHLERSSTGQQLDRLSRRQLDIAIVWGAPRDRSLSFEPIAASKLIAIAPSSHRIAAGPSTTMREVASQPLIIWPRSTSPVTYDITVACLSETCGTWHAAAEASTCPNLVARVLEGAGIGLLFDATPRPASNWGVSAVPISDSPSIQQYVTWRKDCVPDGVRLLVALLADLNDNRT
jgi:DNA-binding transcriptional LysR family regulator